MARILLADDDASTRELVKRALELEGHNVEVAQDGAEALEKLKSQGASVDVLVSDVHMPGVDGITLASHAVDQGGVKVLLMSGFPEELDRARKIKADKLGVLSKPFTLEQVRAAVRALLG